MARLFECPNCNAVWGMEEIDWQECDCCGYPNVDATDFDDDDDYDDYIPHEDCE